MDILLHPLSPTRLWILPTISITVQTGEVPLGDRYLEFFGFANDDAIEHDSGPYYESSTQCFGSYGNETLTELCLRGG